MKFNAISWNAMLRSKVNLMALNNVMNFREQNALSIALQTYR